MTATHTPTPRYEVAPNDNEKVREWNGRIYVSHRRTWDVLRNGECIHGEFGTRREALEYIDAAMDLLAELDKE